MREFLERRNAQLRQDLNLLQRLLEEASPPRELRKFQALLLENCAQWRGLLTRNKAYLGLDNDQILPEILSNTRQAVFYIRLLNTRLAIPVLRAAQTDRLSLATIGWLHKSHMETTDYPPAFGSGECAVVLFAPVPPVYSFPCVEQLGLLYQPLLFHEFGHVLYATHRQEMDELVGELQREVEDLLRPASQRNDLYAEAMATERQVIADTWYMWAQEIFCDAVGITIGGPCFVQAFAAYVQNLDRADYYRGRDMLQGSSHPVTWLRVQFLLQRARMRGLEGLARRVEDEWRRIVRALGVKEDYHGFYDEALERALTRTLDDMLIEGGPRECLPAEAEGGGWSADDSLVRLFNWAWQVYTSDPEHYEFWERDQIKALFMEDHGLQESS
jgi:hypothetical protein